jgi:archaellum component FlaC
VYHARGFSRNDVQSVLPAVFERQAAASQIRGMLEVVGGKQKMGGFMALKDLLFRGASPDRSSASTASPAAAPAMDIRPPASSPQQQTPPASLPSYTPDTSADASELVQQLVKDFKKVVDMNNSPGIDILEFSKALFKKNSTPAAKDYQQVFGVLQAVEENLTPQRLIESSAGYKKIVRDLAAQDIVKGNIRKAEIDGTKVAEKKALDTEQRKLDEEILRLEAELQSKKERIAEIASSLNGIDQKYQTDLDEVAQKLFAIDHASQQVIGSFDDIEDGIRSYLK